MEDYKTILVIDDDLAILEMVQLALRLEGYEVVVASDGETGLALVEQCNPDLVLLDVVMPGIDGFQVLDIIRQTSTVPVIMLTARCEVPVIGNALEHGADDYVRKPFGIRELMARIRAKIRRIDHIVTPENPAKAMTRRPYKAPQFSQNQPTIQVNPD